MSKLTVFNILITSLLSCGLNHSEIQNVDNKNIKDSTDYIQQARLFILQVKHKELNGEQFILEDNPREMDDMDCLKTALSDTVLFSKNDIDSIKANVKKWIVKRWTNEIFPGIKIVNGDTVKSIFHDHSKSWDYFYKHVGNSMDGFSMPVFYKNYTYCLFYSDHYCGWLCAEGSLLLYKKVGTQWIKVKSFCNWVS